MPLVSPKKFSAFRENVLCLTQAELAKRWKLSKTRISDIESADNSAEVRPPNFRRLAELAGMNSERLLEIIGVNGHAQPSGLGIAMRNSVSIPHYHSVPASRPDRRELVERGTIIVPKRSGDQFAVTLDGDSMNPPYPHGATVVFERQEGAEAIVSGSNYHVSFATGEVTFKQVMLDPKRPGIVVLHSRNPDRERFPDMLANREDIAFIARFVGMVEVPNEKPSSLPRTREVRIANFIVAKRVMEETGLYYPPLVMSGYISDQGLGDPDAAGWVIEDNTGPKGERGDIVLSGPNQPWGEKDNVIVDLGRHGGIAVRTVHKIGPPLRLMDGAGRVAPLLGGQKVLGKYMWVTSNPGSQAAPTKGRIAE